MSGEGEGRGWGAGGGGGGGLALTEMHSVFLILISLCIHNCIRNKHMGFKQ